MSTSETTTSTSRFIPALVIGVIVFAFALWMFHHHIWQSLCIGTGAGALYWMWRHWGMTEDAPQYIAPIPAPRAAPTPASASPAPRPVTERVAAPAAPMVSAAPMKAAPMKAAAAPKAARKVAAAKPPAARAKKTVVAIDPKAPAKPKALKAARGGKPDDLKQIKGIGPKLEILCNKLGFFHFDQIAAWTAAEIAWVDENLEGFKGRVTRDTWVAQAALLAKGGDTAFSKRVKKGEVY